MQSTLSLFSTAARLCKTCESNKPKQQEMAHLLCTKEDEQNGFLKCLLHQRHFGFVHVIFCALGWHFRKFRDKTM
jgi:hypothetical protein